MPEHGPNLEDTWKAARREAGGLHCARQPWGAWGVLDCSWQTTVVPPSGPSNQVMARHARDSMRASWASNTMALQQRNLLAGARRGGGGLEALMP